jgi:tRNA-modifying protein YgfZ
MNAQLGLNGIARLGYFGCIRVSGADAKAFLQAQLTSDFLRLDTRRVQVAGFCSAKGRMQASFIAWEVTPSEIVLVCAADLLAATLKRLSLFVLRMRCKLHDATAELPLFGIAGPAADELLGDCTVWSRRETNDATLLRLPDALGQKLGLWVPRQASTLPPRTQTDLSESEWRWLLVHSGIPIIEAKTVDLFVPQMVNFELIGGVDFAKGCYPGQEVVARSQYRGTLKRRMFLFDCDGPAVAGQEVFSSADPGQPAGVVANAAPHPGQPCSSALVELKLAGLGEGTLHLGSPAGPLLTRRELPYRVPMPESAST